MGDVFDMVQVEYERATGHPGRDPEMNVQSHIAQRLERRALTVPTDPGYIADTSRQMAAKLTQRLVRLVRRLDVPSDESLYEDMTGVFTKLFVLIATHDPLRTAGVALSLVDMLDIFQGQIFPECPDAHAFGGSTMLHSRPGASGQVFAHLVMNHMRENWNCSDFCMIAQGIYSLDGDQRAVALKAFTQFLHNTYRICTLENHTSEFKYFRGASWTATPPPQDIFESIRETLTCWSCLANYNFMSNWLKAVTLMMHTTRLNAATYNQTSIQQSKESYRIYFNKNTTLDFRMCVAINPHTAAWCYVSCIEKVSHA